MVGKRTGGRTGEQSDEQAGGWTGGGRRGGHSDGLAGEWQGGKTNRIRNERSEGKALRRATSGNGRTADGLAACELAGRSVLWDVRAVMRAGG